MSKRYPVFPLPVVLFPKTRLPLQIFELRYRRMVKECLKAESGLVMVLSTDREQHDRSYNDIGTYAEIADWSPLPNQMIGIELKGLYSVTLSAPKIESDGLITCATEIIQDKEDRGDSNARLEEIFKRLQQHPLLSLLPLKLQAENILALSYQLGDLLPFSLMDKQRLLEQRCPYQRLELILTLLKDYE